MLSIQSIISSYSQILFRSLRTLAKVSEKEERSLEISSNLLLGLLYQVFLSFLFLHFFFLMFLSQVPWTIPRSPPNLVGRLKNGRKREKRAHHLSEWEANGLVIASVAMCCFIYGRKRFPFFPPSVLPPPHLPPFPSPQH